MAGYATITMSDVMGKEWIVTDSIGTAPLTITANGTYQYGSYPNGPITVTITDSVRPECSTTYPITITC